MLIVGPTGGSWGKLTEDCKNALQDYSIKVNLWTFPIDVIDAMFPPKNTILFTMRTGDPVRPSIIDKINKEYIGLIVPNEANIKTLKKAGIIFDIQKVNLGLNPNQFYPQANNNQHFVFGIAGTECIRKQLSISIESFLQAFPTEENVHLYVKILPNDPLKIPYNPRIVVSKKIFSVEELRSWYQSLNCFVNTSYGEGWGYMIQEAMLCGIPIISPIYGGTKEYITEECGISLPFKIEYEDKISLDVKDVAQAMKKAYQQRNNIHTCGVVARKEASKYSIENFRQNLQKAIYSIASR